MFVKDASHGLARRAIINTLGSARRRSSFGLSRALGVAGSATRTRGDGGRRTSVTAAGHAQPQQARGSNSTLAFALGSVVSGGLGYYLATSHTETNKTNTDFNTQYGTPEDFKVAIKELQDALKDDEDAVSTDEDELERHGLANFGIHPGTCLGRLAASG